MAEFKPVTLEKWGGLQLSQDEAEVGLNGAIDLLNVAFDRPGRVRTRDGYGDFATIAGSTAIASIHAHYRGGSTKQLLASSASGTTKTAAYTTAGVIVSSTTSYSVSGWVNWGSTTAAAAYGAENGGGIVKWDGSTFAPIASQPSDALMVGVQPTDNRLLFVDAAGTKSQLWFSGAGDPETFGATDFLSLTPGDGESISAVATWREMVFVFKRTKFFVFYGNSTDSTGGAVFNYRPVAMGRGAIGQHAVTVAPDGVYFLDRTGIYRTTGGTPELVSAEMAPLFDRTSGAFFQGDDLVASDSANTCALHWHRDRLYLSFPTTGTTPSHTLVYDLRVRAWSLWSIGADAFASWDTSSSVSTDASLFFTDGDTIYELSPSYTDDNGTAITSRYRTGFFSPAGATTPSTIREVLLEGSGTVDVKASTDYGDLGSAAPVALGASPVVTQSRAVVANHGRFHSYEFSSETGQWTLNRATFHVESKSPIGKQP